MIHAIYIYFIINAFIAGYIYSSEENIRLTIIILLFGCLFPLGWLFKWIDKEVELTSWFMFIFTKKWGKMTKNQIDYLRTVYNGRYLSKYRRWVLRIIDKKYNYGITKEK
jgi:hypothetical protein